MVFLRQQTQVYHFSEKNGNIFGQILRNSRKCTRTWMIENVNWSQKRLGILPSSLWKVFLRFFLQMNPIPMRKKQLLSILSLRFYPEKKKQGCFFGYFFVWVPIFDPTLVQYFIQIPNIIFCCQLSAYDKWWFEQKKSPHFREKYLVLSYLNTKSPWTQNGHKACICCCTCSVFRSLFLVRLVVASSNSQTVYPFLIHIDLFGRNNQQSAIK